MERIVYLYRLKEGVKMADFWKWQLETDLPTTSKQPGVLAFQTYEVTGSGQGDRHYDVMEVVEAESYAAWLEVGKQPAMKKVAEEWPLYCDGQSVFEVRVKKIE